MRRTVEINFFSFLKKIKKKKKKKKKIIEYKQNDDGICKDTAPVICFLLDDPTPRNNMLYTK
jgi:hypothetical protein